MLKNIMLAVLFVSAPGVAAEHAERLSISTMVSDVRLAVSPDETHRLWGLVNRTPGAGLEIVESRLVEGQWSAPLPVSFNGPANDFDPSFSPDGRTVYFFSNRPGGAGGDDLYAVSYDPGTRVYGEPRNLGPKVNTDGDEWAPTVSPDGRTLMFASNRHGLSGGQNLFVAPLKGGEIGTPVALDAVIDTAEDEYDATFVGGADRIVFARGDAYGDKGAKLHSAVKDGKGWRDEGPLPPTINCSAELNIGPSVSPSGKFYWSAACGPGETRLDLWTGDLPSVTRR
ncbi:hypothetical protein G4G27_00890 [Sphingomonas sp. So64.6b]|uniref:TolB family protein n=1 Tax=Sphingomonas sp. So64.6b TaxID=2997354 RepID=UPI00160404A9|nr:PD40 domain-containing protein [Sphingomonas sp. So64.6b]QNA82724.1 hypothetical protein G4G27_00890 [Sphingomonas sp. So64.6b]